MIHRLLVLPTLAEELKEAVPNRGKSVTNTGGKPAITVKEKIEAAPKEVRVMYDELANHLLALGDDVTVHPQKHYIAFRRNRNFASVQIYNQKRLVRVYLNLDPDGIELDQKHMRDVRQIGHFELAIWKSPLKTKVTLIPYWI